jgi:DNA modification methylase
MHQSNPNIDLRNYLSNYAFSLGDDLFSSFSTTRIEQIAIDNLLTIPKFTNEFWTSKQRQANSIHEVSYRACFKPQLPKFFIELLTKPGDVVYDPFAGRGTTVIEAALLNRNVIANDINPLSEILCKPRLFIPDFNSLQKRLNEIPIRNEIKQDIDLTMFFHPDTLNEILSIRSYLIDKKNSGIEDEIDMWIRMITTNRLTGHSKGFFSVYTLPPNQAVTQDQQKKINLKRKQVPEYRDTKKIILKKAKALLKNLTADQIERLKTIGTKAVFLNKDSTETEEIKSNSVSLTVTSPPFLDVVQYARDNWLRCWFNNLNAEEIGKKITMSKKVEDWCSVMSGVFKQLYRITKPNGYVAFEVGDVRGGKIKLDEYIADIGIRQNFNCVGIMVNEQSFTKTANIWGVTNNSKGTNTNKIVVFKKL